MAITVEVIESPINVTVTDAGITVDLTPTLIEVITSTTGPQGAIGQTGPRGYAGTQPLFSRAGDLETQIGQGRFYVERSGTITVVRASVGTPPQGGPIIVDVNKNGTSIFTNQNARPTIAAGDYTATGTPAVVALSAGDFLTVDIDAVGTTNTGSDLTVSVTIE